MIDMRVTPHKQAEELRVAISAEIARAVRESLRARGDAGTWVTTCIIESTGPRVTNWNDRAVGPGNAQPTHIARVRVRARLVRRPDGTISHTMVTYSHPRHGAFERKNREHGQVAAEMVVLGAAILV